MSQVTLTFTHRVDGTLANATSAVLSDPTGTFGVKRNDTDGVVVADGAAMTNSATGVYTYTFTEPASDLTYTYYVEWVYGGVTNRAEFSATGSTSSTDLTTLPRVRRQLGVATADAAMDAVLSALIASASRLTEKFTGRLFIYQERTEETTGQGGTFRFVSLQAYPVTDVTSVETRCSQNDDYEEVDVEDYELDEEAGTIWGPFSGRLKTVRTIYTGGYATLPDDLQDAVAMLVASMYRMTTRDPNLTSEKLGDYAWTARGPSEGLKSLSPVAALMLDAYRRPAVSWAVSL